MPTLKKPMVWKEEDGTQYKISFSEKLQMRSLQAIKHQIMWEKRNFYAKVILMILFTLFAVSMLYLIYRLDAVNFFSRLMYK
ncbi:MAG: hypothetical protein QW404_00750 [Candidatus Nanoarchaeia archaeon]